MRNCWRDLGLPRTRRMLSSGVRGGVDEARA
jgi:hypothetical protein